MRYELEMTVCGMTQGIEVGESFADCVRELFSTIHAVPEQFTADYVVAAIECLQAIATKLADDDFEDLSTEMDGEVMGEAWAGTDFITVGFRQAAE